MTEQEKFEQWFKSEFSAGINDMYASSELAKAKANVRCGYLAAKQDSEGEVEQLRANNGELLNRIHEISIDWQVKELENQKLREAFRMRGSFFWDSFWD